MPTNGKCPQNANSTALTSDITLKKLQGGKLVSNV